MLYLIWQIRVVEASKAAASDVLASGYDVDLNLGRLLERFGFFELRSAMPGMKCKRWPKTRAKMVSCTKVEMMQSGCRLRHPTFVQVVPSWLLSSATS